MMAPDASLLFAVRRRGIKLVPPAKTTPLESKQLSDIDSQEGLRFKQPMIFFYRNNPLMAGKDPVKVITEALSQVLVFYYPLAGRLREDSQQKLFVDCTGEGALFVEAEADVRLEEFGDELQLPIPCLEELIYSGSEGFLNSPLLEIQVTRFQCGGFVAAITFSHPMMDGAGFAQFLIGLTELARGAQAPSVLPVWQRELLIARDPPCPSIMHPEYDQVPVAPLGGVLRTIYFGPEELSALRRLVPTHLQNCSTSDVLTAFLWRCRTIALQLAPDEEVCALYIVNARNRSSPPLPAGYYGPVIAFPAAISTSGKLCDNPIGYALELVMKAKASVTGEYMKSVADLMAMKARPCIREDMKTYIISHLIRMGFVKSDFGWGEPAYGGPAINIPDVISYYILYTKKDGEKWIQVPICLPPLTMERFIEEVEKMLGVAR